MHRARHKSRPGTLWGLPAVLGALVGSLTGSVGASAAALPWRWSNPQPHGNNIYDLAYHDGWYWQVGDKGRIYTGTNRLTWTVVPSGTTRALRGIAFAGERVVVGGEAGTLLHGTRAHGLAPATVNPPTTDWFEGVAASPTTGVAVGDNAAIYWSTNGGAAWQRVAGLPFTNWLRSVAWGGGNFVAVGETGLLLTSPDGRTWRRRTSPVSHALNRVVYRGGVFYAVGDQGTLLFSLNAGTNWFRETTGVTNTLYAYAQPDSPAAHPRLLAGESALLLKTTLLGGWTNQLGDAALLPAPTWDYFAAVRDDVRFLVAGRTGMIVESLETNLTLGNVTLDVTLWFEAGDSPRDWLWEVRPLPERYLAVGDRAQVLTSDNGVDWWSVPLPASLTNAVFLGLAATADRALVVGSGGSLMASERLYTSVVVTNTVVAFQDCTRVTNLVVVTNPVNLLGLEWTPAAVGLTTNTLQATATHAGHWVVVGDAGTVLSGDPFPPGSFTLATLSGAPALSGVAGGDPGWVLCGHGGVIFSSPDAAHWTPRSSGTTNWLYRVRWLEDRYVIVGQNGTLLTSPDGVTWSARPTGTTVWLTDAARAGGRFYVCGTQGTVLESPDTLAWTPVEVPTGKALYGLAARDNQLVIAGVEGVILRTMLEPLAPVRVSGYTHQPCTVGGAVDRFQLRGAVDQQVTLEVSEDLRRWQPLATFELKFEESTPELVRTNLPLPPAGYFRFVPRAP